MSNSKSLPIEIHDNETKASLTEPLLSRNDFPEKKGSTTTHRKTFMEILKDDLYFICALGSAICFGSHNYVISYA